MRQAWTLVAVLVGAVCGVAGTSSSDAALAAAQVPAAQPSASSSQFGDFSTRVEVYAKLRDRLDATLPKRPDDATPEQIDRHQRALGDLIRKERKGAKRGDVFNPEAERAIKSVLGRMFGGRDGKELKASIMDENPTDAPVRVNGRYPDEVPLSTVPPQVLAALPKLPPDLEYRFVGNRLILLDVPAHLVVDFIDRALPV